MLGIYGLVGKKVFKLQERRSIEVLGLTKQDLESFSTCKKNKRKGSTHQRVDCINISKKKKCVQQLVNFSFWQKIQRLWLVN